MKDVLQKIIPNIFYYEDRFFTSIKETLMMVGISAVISLFFGLLLGILVVVTSEGKIYENKVINSILSKIINFFRSVPFVLLIALILPFTRIIVGTAIGVKGAVVPMVVAMIAFSSRQFEQVLLEVDDGVIEAGLSMGFSKPYIIYKIILSEARQGLVRTFVICIISLVNYSAMAGTVGGGGLGDFAIRYGYAKYLNDITITCVVLLLILVFAIQAIGNLINKLISH